MIENEPTRRDNAHRRMILDNGWTGVDVVVMSQHEVRYHEPEPDEVCISIGSERWGITAPELSARFVEVLALEFDDTAIGDADFAEAKGLTPEQALQAVEFFARNLKRKRIVIHCFAGLSRSRSMASALCPAFDLPFRYTALNKQVERTVERAIRNFEENKA